MKIFSGIRTESILSPRRGAWRAEPFGITVVGSSVTLRSLGVGDEIREVSDIYDGLGRGTCAREGGRRR